MLNTYILFTHYCGGIVEGLGHCQAWNKGAGLGNVTTTLLEQGLGQRRSIEQDLTTSGSIGAS